MLMLHVYVVSCIPFIWCIELLVIFILAYWLFLIIPNITCFQIFLYIPHSHSYIPIYFPNIIQSLFLILIYFPNIINSLFMIPHIRQTPNFWSHTYDCWLPIYDPTHTTDSPHMQTADSLFMIPQIQLIPHKCNSWLLIYGGRSIWLPPIGRQTTGRHAVWAPDIWALFPIFFCR